jgi:hypothetical protein
MFKFYKPKPTPLPLEPASKVTKQAEKNKLHAANSSHAALDVQRELVRVAFQDTLQATGIPPQWLDCVARYIKAGKQQERLQILLVIKHWDLNLLRYAQAFQSELKQCIDRYEIDVDHSDYEWLWVFGANSITPYPLMPSASEWTHRLQVAEKATAPSLQATNRAAPKNAARTDAVVAKPAAARPRAESIDFHSAFGGLQAQATPPKNSHK